MLSTDSTFCLLAVMYWLFPARSLVFSWKAKSICGFRNHGAPLCPSKMVTLTSWDTLLSTLQVVGLNIQHLPTFSELWGSQIKLPAPVWTLLSLPPLQSQGLFSSLLWQGPVLGFHPCSVPPEEAYGWHKGTKTYEWSHWKEEAWQKDLCEVNWYIYSLNVSHQFGSVSAWDCEGREGCNRSIMSMFWYCGELEWEPGVCSANWTN